MTIKVGVPKMISARIGQAQPSDLDEAIGWASLALNVDEVAWMMSSNGIG